MPHFVDVTNFDTFNAFAKQIEEVVQDEGLNVLINNAGIAQVWGHVEEIEASSLLETFRVNSMGPVLLSKVSSS